MMNGFTVGQGLKIAIFQLARTPDLAAKVAKQLINDSNLSPETIDFIIVATVTRTH